MDIVRPQYISKRRRGFQARFIILPILILLLVGIGLWVHALLSPESMMKSLRRGNTHIQRVAAANYDVPGQAAAHNLAQKYMHAFLTHDYHGMWTMLAPQVQEQWTNEGAFGLYWQHRFEGYTLTNVTFGLASSRSLWVNPETMQSYSNVTVVPISLQLHLNAFNRVAATLPPENVHPEQLFQHLPFVVQHVPGPKEQWLVIAGGPADLEAPILPPLTPVIHVAQVPILMYHHISDAVPQNVLDWSLTVTPTNFAQQLDYLQAQGYHSITFNQLFNALYYDMALPTKPIILTFDDGYEDNYQFAYPLLVKHGYSGMFYIITGKVGWDGQMTWSLLQGMLAHGMQMGSHTVHHVDIGQVLLDSREQAQQELQVSQITLQQKLGIVVQHFCYPSGEPFRHGSVALQQAVMSLLAQDGYIDATTDPGMTGINQQSQYPFILLRTRVDGRELFSEFVKSLPW